MLKQTYVNLAKGNKILGPLDNSQVIFYYISILNEVFYFEKHLL